MPVRILTLRFMTFLNSKFFFIIWLMALIALPFVLGWTPKGSISSVDRFWH
jgi:hypothetical protein